MVRWRAGGLAGGGVVACEERRGGVVAWWRGGVVGGACGVVAWWRGGVVGGREVGRWGGGAVWVKGMNTSIVLTWLRPRLRLRLSDGFS